MSELLYSVSHLDVHFPMRDKGLFGKTRLLRAIDDVSFQVHRGETLGVVGESGCGKSTLLRALMRLGPATAGSLQFEGRELTDLDDKAMQPLRRDLQMIFQDPLASLDPRMTVGQIIGEPLRALEPTLDAASRRERVLELMRRVGLLPEQVNRYAHEFSGGQAQRIGIARALIVEPRLLVCDEPVSALDVSIKSQVINLLMDLRTERGLTYVFIAHDLASVRHIADRVVVLYLGRVMEIADRDALYAAPLHPYTQMLLAAVPIPDPRVARQRRMSVVRGELPSPLDPPSGCAFRTRCPFATRRCAEQRPALRDVGAGQVACHHAEAIAEGRAERASA
ncbi:dipeptide ABC transporter ATP-binding protein [Oleiagrimonas sp. C23AA]|uniref:ABC transporter ATP-binding protein n=1 Tax=Oleiagrimonas sp. C23AA TaxID=2719047 RepID=UPI001422FD65|nr:dipeptide ABC transporter ATP-binding protein [Oleiagrimonas sp. C23AA]NII12162.1 dipeptide ABC transporter ATP-binding protein [Oleiagrimonas sp. C23AA]